MINATVDQLISPTKAPIPDDVLKDIMAELANRTTGNAASLLPPTAPTDFDMDVLAMADEAHALVCKLHADHGCEVDPRFHRMALRHAIGRALRAQTVNVFCPTGPGGGVDPTCGSGGGSAAGDPQHGGEVLKSQVPVERRGTAGRRGDEGAGVFFSPAGQSMPEYGDDVVDARIAKGTKLYRGESSYTFAENRGLMDKVDADVEKLTGLKTLREVDSAFGAGTVETDAFYNAFQTVARRELAREGYHGAHWSTEEDLAPEQYQIWDRSKIVGPSVAQRVRRRNIMNTFCPTGSGGGVDPSCKAGGGQDKLANSPSGHLEPHWHELYLQAKAAGDYAKQWKQNGDKSWTVRVADPVGRTYVHTGSRAYLDKLVAGRYKKYNKSIIDEALEKKFAEGRQG